MRLIAERDIVDEKLTAARSSLVSAEDITFLGLWLDGSTAATARPSQKDPSPNLTHIITQLQYCSLHSRQKKGRRQQPQFYCNTSNYTSLVSGQQEPYSTVPYTRFARIRPLLARLSCFSSFKNPVHQKSFVATNQSTQARNDHVSRTSVQY